MARIARLITPGNVYHVISRFVDREWFFASDNQRARYLALLEHALEKSDWRCLAYCLMSNHMHHAMVAGELSLESWSKKVNSPFANWLNDEHGRLGPIYADRPAAYLVPRHRVAEVIAYIHNNPVRAGVAARARDSSWSSHQAYVGLALRPKWLHVREGLERSGCDPEGDDFEQLVNGLVGASLDLPDLERARAEVRLAGAYEVGTPTLSEPVEVPIVSRQFVPKRPTASAVLDAVSIRLGVSTSAANRRHGRGVISMAKRVVIHVAVAVGVSISDASVLLNVSRQRGAAIAQMSLSSEERALVQEVVDVLLRTAG